MEEHDAVSMSRNSIDTLIDDIGSGKVKVMESRHRNSLDRFYYDCSCCGKDMLDVKHPHLTVGLRKICDDCWNEARKFFNICMDNDFLNDNAAFMDFISDENNKRMAISYLIWESDTQKEMDEFLAMPNDKLVEKICPILERWIPYGHKMELTKESTRKLNTTREHFEKSQYYSRKYGKLKFMSESGDKFKTDKGNVVMFKETT